MTREFLRSLLKRLDASPLPVTDRVRLELEWEVLCMLRDVEPIREWSPERMLIVVTLPGAADLN